MKAIFKEKKNPGVLMEIPSISNLLYAILDLLNHKVIKMEDLVDFSEEFKEKVEKIQNLQKRERNLTVLSKQWKILGLLLMLDVFYSNQFKKDYKVIQNLR